MKQRKLIAIKKFNEVIEAAAGIKFNTLKELQQKLHQLYIGKTDYDEEEGKVYLFLAEGSYTFTENGMSNVIGVWDEEEGIVEFEYKQVFKVDIIKQNIEFLKKQYGTKNWRVQYAEYVLSNTPEREVVEFEK